MLLTDAPETGLVAWVMGMECLEYIGSHLEMIRSYGWTQPRHKMSRGAGETVQRGLDHPGRHAPPASMDGGDFQAIRAAQKNR